MTDAGDVLNRRQNQRDLAELLRVKLGVATPEERLRRLVHEIGHERAELALTARLRSSDTRSSAVRDVKTLEADGSLAVGTTDELEDLLAEVFKPTTIGGEVG